ncbi:hypothetical protein ACFLTD_04815 [Elusimicrobiota bacterium]
MGKTATGIFSDRSRWIKLSVSCLVLVIFGIYSQAMYQRKVVDIEKCLASPLVYDKKLIEIKHDAVVAGIKDDGFSIYVRGNMVHAVYDGTDDSWKDSLGEYISIRAVFHKEGYVEADAYHIHKQRRLKMAFSIIPVLIICFIFFKYYRFDLNNMCFGEK